ncbi:YceI family protein [Belliella kenyensis]|uniref:YceI family protein n=1 Tax=Belliella kenyensis TaxID=1472724 RepID=A0ABV8EKW9_9BACT|nr:YceI family protein [Belliella kenyensis]MCH7403220.1 YceI family protein [Belliella kenyensis]MDN3604831.1 YceI family protein [Belliella kenyensis]
MKKFSFSIIHIMFLAAMMIFHNSTFAQTNYTIASGSTLKVSGTSTLHDWEMVSNTATGKAKFSLENGKVMNAKDLIVTMPAESIKSGKNGMDKNAYSALNTKTHKEVKFVLKELVTLSSGFQAVGDFTIAGVTQSAKFPVNYTVSGEKINFKGKYDCKLTDYKIDPPTALMGTVKTGNEVSIHFDISFQPTK